MKIYNFIYSIQGISNKIIKLKRSIVILNSLLGYQNKSKDYNKMVIIIQRNKTLFNYNKNIARNHN